MAFGHIRSQPIGEGHGQAEMFGAGEKRPAGALGEESVSCYFPAIALCCRRMIPASARNGVRAWGLAPGILAA